ncbi:MAG: sodium:proline symporter, partial [Candidatus Latescibacteria bacterium]|nr:sodium:proline symporter [bacterium]MBD3425482.1 sodium:proline symporter [Candidatus Latescibacterota bacterium]
VMTDMLQFIFAMGGSIYLAVTAFMRVGGVDGLRERLSSAGFDPGRLFRIVPELSWSEPFMEFLVLVLVIWWAAYTIDGGGYLAQRIFAARDERHSLLGYMWFSIAHICLRPWPWIVVGLCGIAFFGAVEDPETYYPLMMKSYLPAGVFGVVIASFFAAFMSTVDTQLNWGSSLVVNDLLKRFIWKGKGEKKYVAAARLVIAFTAICGALVSFLIDDISFAWKFIISVTAGIGSVYIARWYWWRVNAWSEISAMGTALACNMAFWVMESLEQTSGMLFLRFPYSTAITVAVSIPVWISVTLLTKPVGNKKLEDFFLKVRPGGPGWRRIRERVSGVIPAEGSGHTGLKIILGIAAVNSALIGAGKLILGEPVHGVSLLIAAAACSAGIFLMIRPGRANRL